MKSLTDAQEVAAVVPFVLSHGTLVSPRRLLSFNRVQQIPLTFSGLCKDKAYAVNSATLMRVAALREVGGYSDEFWLDLSDVYVFQGLHRKGKYMYIAGDLLVEHSIASMDFDKEMSPERYENFMAAESAYVDLFLPPVERSVSASASLCAHGEAIPPLREQDLFQNHVGVSLAKTVPHEGTPAGTLAVATQERDIPAISDGQTIG